MRKNAYRVGIVKYMAHASLDRIEAGILAGLHDLSVKYETPIDTEGLVFDGQGSNDRLEEIGRILVREDVDLVISIATPTTIAMKRFTEPAKIPLLFRAVSDPVGAGIVPSLREPGKYVTGTSDALDGKELAAVMKTVLEFPVKVGLLYGSEEASSRAPMQEVKDYLWGMGITYVEEKPKSGDQVVEAAKRLIAEKVEAVLTPTDNTVMSVEAELSRLFTEAKIPQFTGSHAFTITGAFLGLGAYYKDTDGQFLELVEDLLFRDLKPSEIPIVKTPHSFVAINNQVCDALGFHREELKLKLDLLGKAVEFYNTEKEIGIKSNA